MNREELENKRHDLDSEIQEVKRGIMEHEQEIVNIEIALERLKKYYTIGLNKCVADLNEKLAAFQAEADLIIKELESNDSQPSS